MTYRQPFRATSRCIVISPLSALLLQFTLLCLLLPLLLAYRTDDHFLTTFFRYGPESLDFLLLCAYGENIWQRV